MICGIYAVLGIYLITAHKVPWREPQPHLGSPSGQDVSARGDHGLAGALRQSRVRPSRGRWGPSSWSRPFCGFSMPKGKRFIEAIA